MIQLEKEQDLLSLLIDRFQNLRDMVSNHIRRGLLHWSELMVLVPIAQIFVSSESKLDKDQIHITPSAGITKNQCFKPVGHGISLHKPKFYPINNGKLHSNLTSQPVST